MASDDSAWHGKPEPDTAVIEIAQKHLHLGETGPFEAKLTIPSNCGKLYDSLKDNDKTGFMCVVPSDTPKVLQREFVAT
jgi:hypothetical protein